MSKIAIIDELCYPALGGQQVRFKELAEAWTESSHSVSIYSIDHLGTLPKLEVIKGVQYHRIIKNPDYYKNGKFGRQISTIFKFTFELRKINWKEYDFVIFNQFPILPALVYGRFIQPITILDFVEHRSGLFWYFIQFLLINSTNQVKLISNTVRENILKYRKKNLEVIPSLVKNSEPNYNSARKYLIFFGRQEEHKHPEDAILAVLDYNKQHNANEKILMMGDGTLHNDLKEKYGTNPAVEFTGRVTDEQKETYLSNSKILILPSEREGLPKVVIESMAYGVPTVTTNYKDNGTCGYVIENKVGAVAEPTIKDISEKIKEVKDDFDRYSSQCKDVVRNHDLKLNSIKYLNE